MREGNLEAVIADTEEARQINYQLRYQVFCQDTGFEDPSDYPDEQEKDEFDASSVHFLVQNADEQEWIAAARLILPTGNLLPIRRHCMIDETNLPVPLEDTAELSRLLMTKGYRRRRADALYPFEHGLVERDRRQKARPESSSPERRETPEILRRLLWAMTTYSMEQTIRQVAFFVTPALARIITRLGIEMIAVGEPFEHRGRRIPYVVDSAQVFRALQGITYAEEVRGTVTPAYRLFSNLSWSSPSISAHAVAGQSVTQVDP